LPSHLKRQPDPPRFSSHYFVDIVQALHDRKPALGIFSRAREEAYRAGFEAGRAQGHIEGAREMEARLNGPF
jgi:hypothetical protein